MTGLRRKNDAMKTDAGIIIKLLFVKFSLLFYSFFCYYEIRRKLGKIIFYGRYKIHQTHRKRIGNFAGFME